MCEHKYSQSTVDIQPKLLGRLPSKRFIDEQ